MMADRGKLSGSKGAVDLKNAAPGMHMDVYSPARTLARLRRPRAAGVRRAANFYGVGRKLGRTLRKFDRKRTPAPRNPAGVELHPQTSNVKLFLSWLRTAAYWFFMEPPFRRMILESQ